MWEGFTDSNMLVDVDTSRSMSRYVLMFAGRVVSLQSRLQKIVALSMTKDECMVVEANKEII